VIISGVKEVSGTIHAEGKIPAIRIDLDRWMKALPQPWTAAMEATMFTGWIYDHLKPHAAALKVAHPLMLRAIAAAKKKNDRIDANKICDCLRCDFPGVLHGLHRSFETGRKTQTQSYGQPHQLRQQMEVWFYSRIETIAERPTRRAEGRKEFTPALLPKRVRRTFCLLTQTYHGSPLRSALTEVVENKGSQIL